MQTQTSTSTSVKRRPAVKKTAKGNGVTIPEPKQASKGSARTLYKYSGKKNRVQNCTDDSFNQNCTRS